jgi:hypothetical protein
MNKAFFQSLFPEGIYVIPEEVKQTMREDVDKTPDFELKYLGENKQKILILVEDPEAEFINERDKEFLSKVLGAVKLTFNDVALLNTYNNSDLTYSYLSDKINFRKLIIFGKEPNDLDDSSLVKYKIAIKIDVEILHADMLAEIQDDKNKKIKLWEELKKLFQ